MKVTVKLTTTGNRSGEPREVTLYAYEDDDRLIVVGSLGGAANDPSWVRNLRAETRATVRQGRAEHEVRAHEVTGKQRERLWKMVVGAFPLYAAYQRKTERVIPLFALEPIPDKD